MTDFQGLLRCLIEARVEFILIGGLAATVHGSARFTQDVDVVYSRSTENLSRIVEALKRLSPYLRGAPPGLPFSWDVATLGAGLNFTLVCSLGDLDLLGEIPGGGGYDKLVGHTVSIQVFGLACLCLDLPTLIHVKRAAGRPKDFEAIAELETILAEEGGPIDERPN